MRSDPWQVRKSVMTNRYSYLLLRLCQEDMRANLIASAEIELV